MPTNWQRPLRPHSARQILRDAAVSRSGCLFDWQLGRRPLATTVSRAILIGPSLKVARTLSLLVTAKVKKNTRTPADMLGGLVAEMAARRHAEPGDLRPAPRLAS